MTWFKVDDGLHRHRKARIAGLEAMGLWTLAGSWVGDELNDGFVPASVLFAWSREHALELAARLEQAGLWEPTVHLGEEGWIFHDWHEFNPSRAEVEARREAERTKKRRQRAPESGPAGTAAGTAGGTPGTGKTKDLKTFPDTPGESPRDKVHAHEPDGNGDCARCPMPRRHPVHRALHAVEESA